MTSSLTANGIQGVILLFQILQFVGVSKRIQCLIITGIIGTVRVFIVVLFIDNSVLLLIQILDTLITLFLAVYWLVGDGFLREFFKIHLADWPCCSDDDPSKSLVHFL